MFSVHVHTTPHARANHPSHHRVRCACSRAHDTPAYVLCSCMSHCTCDQEHGAVLFRGFPFTSVDHFDKFVSSFRGYVCYTCALIVMFVMHVLSSSCLSCMCSHRHVCHACALIVVLPIERCRASDYDERATDLINVILLEPCNDSAS
jgi:hypothetical protein